LCISEGKESILGTDLNALNQRPGVDSRSLLTEEARSAETSHENGETPLNWESAWIDLGGEG
jgi:hypothetical protein